MVEENKTKMEKEDKKIDANVKVAEKPSEEKKEVVEKKEDKKSKDTPKIIKKQEAVARGLDLHLSKRHCMYICSFIMNRSIDESIKKLGEVLKYKRAIPFKGEIPHRKGMMSGRYPQNASREFINLLKGLKANVIMNGLELEKVKIYSASANWAPRPPKSDGRYAKRSHVTIKAKEFNN